MELTYDQVIALAASRYGKFAAPTFDDVLSAHNPHYNEPGHFHTRRWHEMKADALEYPLGKPVGFVACATLLHVEGHCACGKSRRGRSRVKPLADGVVERAIELYKDNSIHAVATAVGVGVSRLRREFSDAGVAIRDDRLKPHRPECAWPGCDRPVKSSQNTYCSLTCYAKTLKRPLQECARDGCTEPIKHNSQKYCSRDCSNAVRRTRALERRARRLSESVKAGRERPQ